MKPIKQFNHFGARLFLTAVFLLALVAGPTSPALAASQSAFGALYTMTNAASGNEVLVYNRSSNGALAFQGSYPTGGLGSGAGLGSQSAVALSHNNHWLFAVNAGSNQISSFAVTESGLQLVDVAASGGTLPVSVTAYKDWLYVLNAGGSGNISGFVVGNDGSLSTLAGSTQPLSNGGAGAAPAVAQIAFSSDGSTLVVTEKSTNLIDTYAVDQGIAGAPLSNASAGTTPFGFAFDRHDHAIVSEAASGSVSSYGIESGELNVISPAVVNTQAAACWIAISNNGKYAYTTNAASGTISSYRIAEDGTLTLLNPTAAVIGAGSSPVDMAFSNNGSTLYALANGAHSISIFQMNADGGLSAQGTIAVPVGVVGLAAR
jgi:6-phosphogluconolactonase (cycloisomerase 2 family)